jgi:hypothetical protein
VSATAGIGRWGLHPKGIQPASCACQHSARSRHWQEAGLRTFNSAVAGGLSTQSGRWPGPLRTRQVVTGRFARGFRSFVHFDLKKRTGLSGFQWPRSTWHARRLPVFFRQVRLLTALFSRVAGQGIEGRVRRKPPERRGRLLSGNAKRQAPRATRAGAGADGGRFANDSRATGEFNRRPIDSLSVETMVSRHEADGWRITHIH